MNIQPLGTPNVSGRQPQPVSVRTPLDREMKEAAEDESFVRGDYEGDYCPTGLPYGGNKVTPLIDGDAIFASAKEMVDSAKDRVRVEMYDLNDLEMVNTLIDATKRGVEVKVILDPSVNDIESDKRANINKLMEDNGIEMIQFPNSGNQNDHIKLLLVDGTKAMVGGMNWNTYSRNNHDANVTIEGPAVKYYESHFVEGWNYSGGPRIDPSTVEVEAESIPKAGDAEVKGVRTNGKLDSSYKRNVQETIRGAKKSIFTEMYVLSSEDIVNDLIDAKERGVDVRVILDPHNAYTGWSPNGKTFDTLKKAGVDVRWYKVEPTQRMHAKWTVVDGEETLIGSGNWSHKGFNTNRELGADIKDKETANVFEEQFRYDWRYQAQEEYPL